jgi:hypothetical protein
LRKHSPEGAYFRKRPGREAAKESQQADCPQDCTILDVCRRSLTRNNLGCLIVARRGLFHLKKNHFFQQILDRFDIRCVPGHLPVVDRKPGSFSIEQRQIDLLQVIAFLVFPVFCYLNGLRI